MKSDEKTYIPRILDPLLGDLLEELPALAIDGPKAVGKTVIPSFSSAARIPRRRRCIRGPAG